MGAAKNVKAQKLKPATLPKPRTVAAQKSLMDLQHAHQVEAIIRQRVYRPMVYKSEESRQRALSKLNPIKPGEVRGHHGKKIRKPFHQAALELADANLSALHIQPTDTVAEAVLKSQARKAVMWADTPAAKEFADRAEGPPEQTKLDIENENKSEQGVTDVIARFGIQLNVNVNS